MRQLTSLDAQFLAIEDARQFGHVGSLGIYDPSTSPSGVFNGDTITRLLTERLPLLPPLRWRLAEVPFGLDYPYWVEDSDFDPEFHVRESALPAPGTDEQLADLVARLHSRPLDRAKPLWEIYVISGLQSGHVGLYIKIHHALIDGMSGAEVVGLLLDLSPDARVAPVEKAGQLGRRATNTGMAARALVGFPRYPFRALRSLPGALPHLDETTYAAVPGVARLGRLLGRAEGMLRRDAGRIVRPTLAAPKVGFSGRISSHRRFAFGQLPLDRVKAVKDAHCVSVNDVVVAMCAGAVRRWLLEHDDLPEAPLVVQIPVSVRSEAEVGTYGNRIVLLGVALHTEIADPVARLRATSEDLSVMKTRHKALPAELLSNVNHFIPPALFSLASRLTFALSTSGAGRPIWNLVISNVPGPQTNLYCAGAQLIAQYPVSAITDGMGLNITVMSYAGHLDIGIIADREQMPDTADLVGWMEEALAELEAFAPVTDISPVIAARSTRKRVTS